MSKRDQELAHTAGLLHDIGKFALSDRVMERGGQLEEADWRGIRRHPDIGAELLRDIGVYGPVAEIVRAHHERMDGRGYPRRLKGEEIPAIVPAAVRALARPRRGPAAAAPGQPHAWTVSDLPLLDAARQRLGDPEASRRRRRHEAAVAAERDEMTRVVDHLIATDDSDLQVMSMLRGQDLRRCPGRRGRRADDRPRPARRSVRPHRRGRGPGADRRRVADAPAPLPLAQPHHRRGPRPGPARVHRVVAGTPRTGRARPRQPARR